MRSFSVSVYRSATPKEEYFKVSVLSMVMVKYGQFITVLRRETVPWEDPSQITSTCVVALREAKVQEKETPLKCLPLLVLVCQSAEYD